MKHAIILILQILLCFSTYAQTLIPQQDKKGKWGYVKPETPKKYIVRPKYDAAYYFVDGRGRFLTQQKDGSKYGFIDSTGQIVITPIYESATDFLGGLSICSINNKYGIINTDGSVIVDYIYKSIKRQSTYYVGENNNGKKDIILYINQSLRIQSFDLISTSSSTLGIKAIRNGECYYLDPLSGVERYHEIESEGNVTICEDLTKESTYILLAEAASDNKTLKSISAPDEYGRRVATTLQGKTILIGKNGSTLLSDIVQVINGYYLTSKNWPEVNLIGKDINNSLLSGICKSIEGDTIVIQDPKSEATIFFDTNKLEAGICAVDGNISCGPIPSSIFIKCEDSHSLLVFFVSANEVRIYNAKGEPMWQDIKPNKVEFFTVRDKKMIVMQNNQGYFIGRLDGSRLLSQFSSFSVQSYPPNMGSLTAEDGSIITGEFDILDGHPVLCGREYNYNSYTWYYDLEKLLFGKIDKTKKILSQASSHKKIVPPMGLDFLKEVNSWKQNTGSGGWSIVSHKPGTEAAILEFSFLPQKIGEREMTLFMFLREGKKLINAPDDSYMGTLIMDSEGNLTITNATGITGKYNFAGKYRLEKN